MRVKCLAQHKSPDKARTRTARSVGDSTNHEASPPPHLRWCRWRDFASAFVFAAIGVRRERRTSLRVIFPQENKGSAAKNIPAAHAVASPNSCLEARHINLVQLIFSKRVTFTVMS